MKNANINVRIEESLYRSLKELGVDISEAVRMALINEVERRRLELIMRELDKASTAVKKMGMESIVAEIRKAREQR